MTVFLANSFMRLAAEMPTAPQGGASDNIERQPT